MTPCVRFASFRPCGAFSFHDLHRMAQWFATSTGVEKYGLVNALMPIGNSFLEVVAPTREGTAAGRCLERRDGEGGYMVILECDDI